jgi:hypothetical protein
LQGNLPFLASSIRRGAAHIINYSDFFGRSPGERRADPRGLRDQLHKYLAEPGSRGAKESLRSALNHSQEVYQDCLKARQLSPAFKARHPELMAQLSEYHWAKGRIITGIGDRIEWRADPAQIEELRSLEPLFEEVNRGIREVQREIADHLKELDRQSAESKSATHKRVVKET